MAGVAMYRSQVDELETRMESVTNDLRDLLERIPHGNWPNRILSMFTKFNSFTSKTKKGGTVVDNSLPQAGLVL